MNARAPISYRPTIDRKKLESLITRKLHYKAVNRFIDEAVREKIERDLSGSGEAKLKRLLDQVSQAVSEYKGWTMHKPSKALAREIEKKAGPMESGKTKPVAWKGSLAETKS